tara:strand:+ start:314 stop:616 length:303 start_codon:yes stop_codon:yes gene_type:complete
MDVVVQQLTTTEGVLYALATALGSLGIVAALYDPIRDMVEKKSTGALRPVTAILLAASFLLKTPYLRGRDAVLSFIICIAWGVGWVLIFVLSLTAFVLHG